MIIPELIALRAAGKFEVDHLVTTDFFGRIADAVADAAAGEGRQAGPGVVRIAEE